MQIGTQIESTSTKADSKNNRPKSIRMYSRRHAIANNTRKKECQRKNETKTEIISTEILTSYRAEEQSGRSENVALQSSPSKFSHVVELLSSDSKEFTEISSQTFDESHLRQAKIHYDIEGEESLSLTTARTALPTFPWLVFDVDAIPMHKKHIAYLTENDTKQVVKLTDHYDTCEDDWIIRHVYNPRWKRHFSVVRERYEETTFDGDDDAATVRSICTIFGHLTSHSKVCQHPRFEVSVPVKPDLVASHWKISTANSTIDARIDHPMTLTIHELLSCREFNWFPCSGNAILPHIVVECKGEASDKSDVIKLLIEMAMLRDFEERFYQQTRQYTLAIYVRGCTWQVFVLEYTNKDGFKYEAHSVARFTLTKNYLTWLQLGVVTARLAAYQTYCTLKLIPRPFLELKEVLQEANRLWIARTNSKRGQKKIEADNNETDSDVEKSTTQKSKKRKAHHDNDAGPDRKRPRRQTSTSTLLRQAANVPNANQQLQNASSERITNQLQQRKGLIYPGHYTRVYRCFDEATGQDIAIKEFDSNADGYYEAGVLRRLTGDGIVKKVRDVHTKLNGKVQIWLELLSPLPDYTDPQELKHFMRGLLEALDYMHFQNYIHGDIKHDNVMVDPKTNQIKLIDFGCSSEVWPGQTCRYFHGGTAVYFAPERIYDEPQTHKLDVFSAGLVGAEKMYGIRIRSMEEREVLIAKVQKGELGGLATEGGVDLLQQMLKLDPDERLSADECLQHPFLNERMDGSD